MSVIRTTLAALALCTLGATAAMAQSADAATTPTQGQILLVVTNHDVMGDTGKPTGYWMAEVSHAWCVFTDAGYAVTFASPKGGIAPADPRSFDLSDADNKRMWSQRSVIEALADTRPLTGVDPADYKAVYFAGGHGTMWDFPDSAALQKVTAAIYEQGGVVSAVCHGPAALVNVKLSDGKYLVEGKPVTGFSNAEEDAAGLTQAVPFLLESKLKERGGQVTVAENFKPHVVQADRLLTGQNPASSRPLAEAVVQRLSEQP